MARPIIICGECGEEKPHAAFGLCQQCYSRQYEVTRREQKRKYYIENREKILMHTAKWKEENKEYLDEYNNKYRKENAEAHRESNNRWLEQNQNYKREYHLKRMYNMSLAEYDERLGAQDNKCAICGMGVAEHGRRLFVDHDHETGEVRGLLCQNCNMLLGHALDNVGILLNAVSYLRG